MNKRVIVVGGGLAGLSSAIRLARMGCEVQLFEKNASLGGKMNERYLGSYHFDTGPSLLTMPFLIDELFAFAGFERSELLSFQPVDPICRYFYPDGSQLDTSADLTAMVKNIDAFSPGEGRGYRGFLEYAGRIYDRTVDTFLFNPIHEPSKMLDRKNLPTLLNILQLDPFRTVHQGVSRFFNDQRLRQLFDRYATYNGSSPFQAPATLNIIPYVEYGLGGYYIRGGMYRLVEAMVKVAERIGVRMYLGANVEKITHSRDRVTGIRVNGVHHPADYVVANSDVVTTFAKLINGYPAREKQLRALEPSSSGMVFFWGVREQYPALAHHNIFFSENYREEFHQIFNEKSTPDDPTIYIAITSKTDPVHAPQNGENWFVLLNMPYLTGRHDWTEEVRKMRKTVLDKLAKFGFDMNEKILHEQVITPIDFSEDYGSNRGSIYGISSNSKMAAFNRPANRNRQIQGLYFAGGSAHPGGGIPLVLLSGKLAAELIAEHAGYAENDVQNSNLSTTEYTK